MRHSLFVGIITLGIMVLPGNSFAGDELTSKQKWVLDKIEIKVEGLVQVARGDVRECENQPEFLSGVGIWPNNGCDCDGPGRCVEKNFANALEELKLWASGTFDGSYSDHQNQRKTGIPCKQVGRDILCGPIELPKSEIQGLVDSAVKKMLSKSSKHNKGLRLPLIFQNLNRPRPSFRMPFFARVGHKSASVPVTMAQVREALSFSEKAQEREIARFMRVYEAAGVPMEIDAALWEPYKKKMESAAANLMKTVKPVRKRGRKAGKYGISMAKKKVKKIYPNAKIRKAFMAGDGWDIKTNRYGKNLSRKTWGVVVYSPPDEKVCRAINFDVYEKANGRKFKKTKDVSGLTDESLSECR